MEWYGREGKRKLAKKATLTAGALGRRGKLHTRQERKCGHVASGGVRSFFAFLVMYSLYLESR